MSKFNIRDKVVKTLDRIEGDISSSAWGSLTFGYAVGLVACVAAVAVANKLND